MYVDMLFDANLELYVKDLAVFDFFDLEAESLLSNYFYYDILDYTQQDFIL